MSDQWYKAGEKNPLDEISIPFPNLTDEAKKAATKLHAMVVHNKCIKAGKTELAAKIAEKYRLPDPAMDDLVVAFGFAMINSMKK